MAKVVRAGDKNWTTPHFGWPLVNWCNYECEYCYAIDSMVKKFDPETSPSKHKLILARLRNLKMPFTIDIVGGEPTFHPHVVEIMTELGKMDHCERIELVTNLSKPLAFFKKFDIPELTKANITASFHPGQCNNSENFLNKATEMAKSEYIDFGVEVMVPDDTSLWDKTTKMIQDLQDNEVQCCALFLYETPYWKPNYPPEVYDKFLSSFDDLAEIKYEYDDGTSEILRDDEIYKRGYNRFKGYKCSSMMYEIRPDGVIENSCTRRQLPLTITKDSVVKMEKCPCDVCFCKIMLYFYKELDT